jgi:tRNA threonylcarbamoyladenosine biosynthesis protein TsaE
MSWRPVVAGTSGAHETQALAAAVASVAKAGDVIVLAGEMGAGKTTFAQGFARGLGITEQVTSPTFTIIREYSGPTLALHHLDVYRLDHLREVVDLGLGEMLDEDAVMLVEWGDAVLPALPDQYLDVRLVFGEGDAAGDDDRRIELSPRGSSWSARHRALSDALAPWCSAAGSEGVG